MADAYGYRYLGLFFRPFIEVTEDGFRYKGRDYSWSDVESVDARYQRTQLIILRILLFAPVGNHGALVRLNDGRRIRLNARILEKAGRKPRVGFVSERSDAYDELIDTFLEKTGAG